MAERVRDDARSPYQRYGKTPFKYSPWVTEKRNPPLPIQQQLFKAGGWTDKKGRAREFVNVNAPKQS
jgi:hypothetical protein